MIENKEKIIKDDINFLEYPNWIVSTNKKITTWSIKKENGNYELVCPYGLPKHFDKTVLYYLLYQLYKKNGFEKYELVTTRYEIAKGIFGGSHFSKNVYLRIMSALQKWTAIYIKFEGVFYKAGQYITKNFHIIDETTLIHESGELTIRFNEGYIKQLKESKFYKLIDFEQHRKFTRASSARLFEILIKTFKDQNEWAINIQSLAEKLTFEKREGVKNYYPSDVLRHLKPGISEINKKSDMVIDFKYNTETGICIFKKLKKRKEVFTLPGKARSDAWVPAAKDQIKNSKNKKTTEKQLEECLEQFNLLPQEEKDEIMRAIKMNHFYQLQSNDNQRIFSYMTNNKLLKPIE